MMADTSAWIEYLRNTGSRSHLRLREALTSGERVLMPPVVLQEVLQGAATPQRFMRLRELIDATAKPWAAVDAHETARLAAALYARCRWSGLTPRGPNDCLIVACAIEAGEPLLHADRDFDRIASIEPRLRFA